jgi:hypothetical protein
VEFRDERVRIGGAEGPPRHRSAVAQPTGVHEWEAQVESKIASGLLFEGAYCCVKERFGFKPYSPLVGTYAPREVNKTVNLHAFDPVRFLCGLSYNCFLCVSCAACRITVRV